MVGFSNIIPLSMDGMLLRGSELGRWALLRLFLTLVIPVN